MVTTTSVADELCKGAVPASYGFFQSKPTTVGEIRRVEGGPAPGGRLWPNALPGHSDTDDAAWCHGKDGGNGYVAYVVAVDGTSEVLGFERVIDAPPPPGPPMVE